MFIPDPLGNLGKIITKGMGKLKALSKPLREKIGGTFGKSNKPNRSGNKADFDPNKHKLNKAQLQKLNDDLADNKALKDAMDGVNGNPALVDSWKKLDDVGHNVRKNPDLLKKMNDLSPAKQEKLKDLYKNQKAPKNRKGQVNFTETKTIDGKSVSVKYDKEGFPDFTPHSPGKEYAFKSDDALKGHDPNLPPNVVRPDNAFANNSLTSKFGEDNVVVLHPTGSPIKVKIDGKWEGPYTWHHHQDGQTMMLVNQKTHNTFKHTGGNDVISKGLQEVFKPPY
jgi:hypothetical protein